MKLLMCTQAVDKNDPILGFFHNWLEEFSKHFESILVICLKEGEHTLPKNVSVYSLGKENGESRVKYIARFYKHLFHLRGTYDSVFVHMNPHYVILGGLFWLVARIPVFFWRNHARMNLMTEVAAVFARKIFYTSPFACTSKYKHSVQMPVGIDTVRFTPSRAPSGSAKKILFLGRLSPVKRPEIFIHAGKFLPPEYELHVYGDDPTKDKKYFDSLKNISGHNVFFHPAVKNFETPALYQSHDVYVNLTPEGSMDKTVLEAVACGTPVIVTNTSFSEVVSPFSILTTPFSESLAEKIVASVNLSAEEKEKSARGALNAVMEKHSLQKLATMVYNHMK